MQKIFALICCLSLVCSAPASVPKPDAGADDSMHQIQIVVADQIFPAVLYKNETTDALIGRFPMTLNMNDLNGNEKYYYFANDFPANAEKPSDIHAGDLMLYGKDCLVLFYDSFSSSHSYTPLGYVEDASGLASALGNGSAQISLVTQ